MHSPPTPTPHPNYCWFSFVAKREMNHLSLRDTETTQIWGGGGGGGGVKQTTSILPSTTFVELMLAVLN